MYTISEKSIADLHRRGYAAQQRNHLEVCGVLVCKEFRIHRLWFLENVRDEPYSHGMRESDIVRVEESLNDEGSVVLGSFHTHPVGEAQPSSGDIEHGFYSGMELIYDVCGEEARLWRKLVTGSKTTILEVELRVVPGG